MANKNKKNTANRQKYMKYAGMAFQMFATILLCVLAGMQLDKFLATTPLFTVVFILLGVAGSMWVVIKDFI